jgi:hypothetical protein
VAAADEDAAGHARIPQTEHIHSTLANRNRQQHDETQPGLSPPRPNRLEPQARYVSKSPRPRRYDPVGEGRDRRKAIGNKKSPLFTAGSVPRSRRYPPCTTKFDCSPHRHSVPVALTSFTIAGTVQLLSPLLIVREMAVYLPDHSFSLPLRQVNVWIAKSPVPFVTEANAWSYRPFYDCGFTGAPIALSVAGFRKGRNSWQNSC